MKYKFFLLTATMTLFVVSAVTAQEDTRDQLKSYSYVEVQGGIQLTPTDADKAKLVTPTAAISFGHYFTPAVGARLHVNAWQSKSGFSDIDKYYKWKYITPSADLLINLTNLFAKTPQHGLNVILLGGIGLNYAWDNDELTDLNLPISRVPLAWKDHKLSHNIRAGLRFETDVTKPLGVAIEVNANSIDDRFNSKTNFRDDWQFTAMLSVNYRFGKRYQKPAPVLIPNIPEFPPEDPDPKRVPAKPEIKEEKPAPKTDAIVKVVEEPYKDVLFYAIRDSEIDPESIVAAAAAWCKKYPNKTLNVSGYADKGTGNAKLNQMYSERRTNKVVDMLKKNGVPASQIKAASYGDTVQPYAENDKNRCVILEGK